MSKISIILPSYNEEAGLTKILPHLSKEFPDAEIIVVDDASTDQTKNVAQQYNVKVISHPYTMGNGAAIKAGTRKASGDVLIFMDADGQHPVKEVNRLITELNDNVDMVVGARTSGAHANIVRRIGNFLYNKLASFITGHNIRDLTSGFRVVKRDKFIEFINILPNGFSYPTTITMAFFRVGYTIKYVPVNVMKDTGESHINLFKDGIKFLLIIFRITALYSPLKIFGPASLTFFAGGVGYYCYTYLSQGRFTNMGILLLLTSVIVFLIGLLSEQITFLIYSQNHNK